jgi:hypothetical protein
MLEGEFLMSLPYVDLREAGPPMMMPFIKTDPRSAVWTRAYRNHHVLRNGSLKIRPPENGLGGIGVGWA